MTTQIKGYPFEVVIAINDKRTAVLADQIKSLDWRARKAKFKSRISEKDLALVRAKFKPLLQLS